MNEFGFPDDEYFGIEPEGIQPEPGPDDHGFYSEIWDSPSQFFSVQEKQDDDPFLQEQEKAMEAAAREEAQQERIAARHARHRDADEERAFRSWRHDFEKVQENSEFESSKEKEERMLPPVQKNDHETERLEVTPDEEDHLLSLDLGVKTATPEELHSFAKKIKDDPVLKKYGLQLNKTDLDPMKNTNASFLDIVRDRVWGENFQNDIESLRRRGKELFKKDFGEAVGSMDDLGDTMAEVEFIHATAAGEKTVHSSDFQETDYSENGTSDKEYPDFDTPEEEDESWPPD